MPRADRGFSFPVGEGPASHATDALQHGHPRSRQLAEVVALAVREEAQGLGIGRMLVERVGEEARALGVGTIFALTLQDSFFHRLGFRTVPKELFPVKVWADCRSCPSRDACMEIAVEREIQL